jgi:hypothetical protein
MLNEDASISTRLTVPCTGLGREYALEFAKRGAKVVGKLHLQLML